jgi:protein-S-isoprenylcysteine O-methyltransferase Ste14
VGLFTGASTRDTVIAWAFVLVQAALLLAILLLPAADDWTNPAWLATAARWLEFMGFVVLALGLLNLGTALTPLPLPVPHGTMRSGGLYRIVRHPIYSGVMALAIGAAIRSCNVVIAVAAAGLVALFATKARWEERRLAERYPEYEDYAARTPRFVPFWPVGLSRPRRG